MEKKDVKECKEIALDFYRCAGQRWASTSNTIDLYETNFGEANVAEEFGLNGMLALASFFAISAVGASVAAAAVTGKGGAAAVYVGTNLFGSAEIAVIAARTATAVAIEAGKRTVHEVFDPDGFNLVNEKEYDSTDNLISLISVFVAGVGSIGTKIPYPTAHYGKFMDLFLKSVSGSLLIGKEGMKGAITYDKWAIRNITTADLGKIVENADKFSLKQQVTTTGNGAACSLLEHALENKYYAQKHSMESGQAEALVKALWDESPALYRFWDWVRNERLSRNMKTAVELHFSAAASMGYWLAVHRSLTMIELSMKRSNDLIDRHAK